MNRYWARETRRGLGGRGIAVASLVAGLLVWEALSRLIHSKLILPSAFDVVGQFAEGIRTGVLMPHILASLWRIIVGFLAGSFVGLALGLLMSMAKLARMVLDPVTNFFRFIPTICWISPFLIWFGIGEMSKDLVITYTVTFMVTLSTYAGVRSIPVNKIRAARCFGAGRFVLFTRVILPSLVREVRLGMRIALGNAFTTVVTAEMIAAQFGLGYIILNSRNFGATDQIILAMFCLGALGFVVDRLFEIGSKAALARYLRM
jgi:NitT/TauT family transport system permease protein